MGDAADDSKQTTKTPWLANDAWRHGVSIVVASAALVAMIAVTAWLLVVLGDGDEIDALPVGKQITVALIGVMLLLYGVLYLTLTAVVFRRFRGDDLRRVAATSAARTSERRFTLLLMGGDEIVFPVTTVLMTLAGVIGIVLVPEFASNATLIVGALAGVAGGWLMMVTSFSVSYLREWAIRDSVRLAEAGTATDGGSAVQPLRSDGRRFSDFIYVAVQFATSYSATDFQLVGARVRKIATLNSVLAFLYGTVIIAMFLSFAVSAGFAD